MDYTKVLDLMPSLVMGLGIWYLKKLLDKRDVKIESREKAREQNEILLIKSVGASLSLGEATAIAIKNGKSNGELESALAYAKTVKHEQKEFLNEQAVKNVL